MANSCTNELKAQVNTEINAAMTYLAMVIAFFHCFTMYFVEKYYIYTFFFILGCSFCS